MIRAKAFIIMFTFLFCAGSLPFAGGASPCEASDYYDGDVPEEKAAEYIESYAFTLELSDPGSKGAAIACFDVNEAGMIAVGYNNKRIAVYDSEMNYIYGYSFNTSGSYGLMWDGEYIAVYCVRGRKIFVLDGQNGVVSIKKASDSLSISTEHDRSYFASVRKANDRTYRLENKGVSRFLTGSYSVFTVEENEERMVLIDNSREQNAGAITFCVLIALIFAICAAVNIMRIKKQKEKRQRIIEGE